ncbi:MAG TPA: altronate hydrolase, partial [Verrucomicrobiae bacterium]|nr:altronate hydrolase [Verrucomicrobiae bacterium]
MNEPLPFSEIARLPVVADNVAIALRTISAGDRVLIRQLVFEFAHTILEGHRFAVHRIRKGEPLLSWGLPFGLATRDLEPGEYVCNEKILRALSERSVDFDLPKTPNFIDHRLAYKMDESKFEPGSQVQASAAAPVFLGFPR